MIRVECEICSRLRRDKQMRSSVHCVYCARAVSCVSCGSVLKSQQKLSRHRAGRVCAEESVEHVLEMAGWRRCGTLSRSLRKRGFTVRYVPRWIVAGNAPLETPVAHHPKLWKEPTAEVPPPPPWPTAAFEAATERLVAHSMLLTLGGS